MLSIFGPKARDGITRREVLRIGGKAGLWNRWLHRWVPWMRNHARDIALRCEVGLADDLTRGLMEDEKTRIAWNLPRVLLAKNRVKLLLNMMLLAAQAIPRGGQLTVDPVGEGDTVGFKVTSTGTNAKVPQSVPPLLAGGSAEHPIDAHAIQPFYTGLLAKNCGLSVAMAVEGEAVVVIAR